MICGSQSRVCPVCPRTMLAGNFKIRRNNALCSNTAKANNDSWLQQKSLIILNRENRLLFPLLLGHGYPEDDISKY